MSIVNSVKVEKFADKAIKINVDKKYQHLLPVIDEHECSFTLTGANNAISGALIRSMGGELSVRYLHCSFDDVVTNDVYIIADMIAQRIIQIPINQKIAIGTKFELRVTNTTPFSREIKSGDITGYKAADKLFNQNITICEIKKGKYIHIKAVVSSSYPYIPGMGAIGLVSRQVSIPVDVEQRDIYARTGVSCSIARPTEYNIRFLTYGTMDSREIIIAACKDIIARATRVNDFIQTKTVLGNTHTYKIINESMTILMLFSRIAADLFYENCTMTVRDDVDLRESTISIRTDDDADDIMQKIADNIVTQFIKIQKMFS